jgi:hypothetical protein
MLSSSLTKLLFEAITYFILYQYTTVIIKRNELIISVNVYLLEVMKFQLFWRHFVSIHLRNPFSKILTNVPEANKIIFSLALTVFIPDSLKEEKPDIKC